MSKKVEDIKVYALKPEFAANISDSWDTDYINKCLAEFLFEFDRSFALEKYEPGETGIFIDKEVVGKFQMGQFNNLSPKDQDLNYSKLLFGEDFENPGIYFLDDNDHKQPLTIVQATDPRIWNYLALFVLNDYCSDRWGNKRDFSRIISKSVTLNSSSRHSILRLYWSALLCADSVRENILELLDQLWISEDFMSQVLERSTASMKPQIQCLLEFCSKPKNKVLLFEKDSIEGYRNYRKFLKLFLADSFVFSLPMQSKEETESLLQESLDACLIK